MFFADLTHLLDAGNEHVARTLSQDLKLQPTSSVGERLTRHSRSDSDQRSRSVATSTTTRSITRP
jgi:hypothetical protein